MMMKKKVVRAKGNTDKTNKDTILAQMHELRPLPLGRKEFEEWSDRIISGALIPNSCGRVFQIMDIGAADEKALNEIHLESQKFCLANMLMHLGPTESHKPDAFFIHSLRKFAVNQVADDMRQELHAKAKARLKIPEKAQEEECA